MTIVLHPLRKRKQFVALRDCGNKIVMPCFVLQYAPIAAHPSLSIADSKNCNENTSFIGFTVTKKLGNAVLRNRIKRRLRAVVHELFPVHAQSGYAYVIIGRHSISDHDIASLRKQCLKAMQRAHKESVFYENRQAV